MAVTERELPDILEDRRHFASRTTDAYGSRKETYNEWNERIRILDHIASNEWEVVWPDQKRERALPKIPNWVTLALEHRSRLIAETPPTVMRRPEKIAEDAKKAAEKIERVILGWWQQNRLFHNLPYWGIDLMLSGFAAVKVLPDFSKEAAERFPVYTRIDPRMCYPSPVFTSGPFVDDCIIGYEETIPVIEGRFGVNLGGMMDEAKRLSADAERSKVDVIEWYDGKQAMVVAQARFASDNGKRRPFEVVLDEKHDIGKCPVAIGVRPTHDGTYRGDFDSLIAMLNTNNRLMTLHIDAAVSKVYPVLLADDKVENPDDEGPGALINVESGDGPVLNHIGYLQHPASAYDNYNMLRMMDNNLRTSALLPQSVTGNPDESVISAAGIAATQSMPNAEVVALQRDSLSPMLQAANELAMRGDERWGDTKKTITGVQRGAPFAETYSPKSDIDGNYANEVVYGIGSGLDKVNTGIMVKQDLGAGLISKREARELNPNVSDPQRTEAMILAEQMQDVSIASILQATQLPPGDPNRVELVQVAKIWEDIDKGTSVREALMNHVERIALVPPPNPTPQGGNLASPGIAGAAEPQPPAFSGPPVEQLVG